MQTLQKRVSRMKTKVTVAHTLVRLTGLILIILSFLSWSGNGLSLIPISMLVGVMLALSLWALALQSVRAGAHPILVILGVLLGGLVLVLGLTADWFLYVLASVGAIGQAEEMAAWTRHKAPMHSRR